MTNYNIHISKPVSKIEIQKQNGSAFIHFSQVEQTRHGNLHLWHSGYNGSLKNGYVGYFMDEMEVRISLPEEVYNRFQRQIRKAVESEKLENRESV